MEVMSRFMVWLWWWCHRCLLTSKRITVYICIMYNLYMLKKKKKKWGRNSGHVLARVGGNRMKLAWECDLSLLWIWPWDGYSQKGMSWKFSMIVQGCGDSLTRQVSPWGRKESDTTERLHFHFSSKILFQSANHVRSWMRDFPSSSVHWLSEPQWTYVMLSMRLSSDQSPFKCSSVTHGSWPQC